MLTSYPESRTGSYFILKALSDLGIRFMFANTGTDHAPLIEELARLQSESDETLQFILCPHENTAAHMAGGYALMTGRGQPVLVHVDAGTANTVTAMHNLYRGRIPVLLMAGKAPFTTFGELTGTRDNYVQFVQEPFDQGSLVRPYVKWEYTLPSAAVATRTIHRAAALMNSDPKGPVYLMLPRETIAEEFNPDKVVTPPYERQETVSVRGLDQESVAVLGEKLLVAETPILITSYSGMRDGASDAIDRLSQLAGMRVYEPNMIVNISHEMPCFCGHSASKGMEAADFGLLVDTDVPWMPSEVAPSSKTFWAHIDVDPLKHGSPMWDFPASLRFSADSAIALEQLADYVESQTTGAFEAKARIRRASILSERQASRDSLAEKAAIPGRLGAINPAYLFSQLSIAIKPDDIILHEAVRNQLALVQHIRRPVAKTLARVAGGGLGSSSGMALGVKLARPEALVIQITGDGAFYFNSPLSALAVSKKYKLPILTIILDNGGWSAVKTSTLKMYPEGFASSTDEHASDIGVDANFSNLSSVFDCKGYYLEDPDKVTEVLTSALADARQGSSVILHVKITPH